MRKIKQLIIATFTVIAVTFTAKQATAQVTWSNATPCYYVGVFVSGSCPINFTCPTLTSGYYYDVPDNYTWTESGIGLIDQGGIYQHWSDIRGMCLKDINSGATYFIDFCNFGTTGMVTFPAPSGCGGGDLNVYWDITTSPAVVKLWP